MVLNYIWIGFFVVALIVGIVRTLGYYLQRGVDSGAGAFFDVSDKLVFRDMVQSTFDMAETSVEISIYLIGVMTLWLGIMRIGENAGMIDKLSKIVAPFFRRIFPEIPDKHPAMGAILMNFGANMLGLDNAATPLGIKAMEQMQSLNKKKDTASNAQIMFLVLNTSALTIVPVSIITLRAAAGAANPADVFLPLLFSTFFSSLAGLIVVSVFQRINLFNRIVIAYVGGISLIISLMFVFLRTLSDSQLNSFSVLSGNMTLFLIISVFIIAGARRKINVYNVFIEGAKEGFGISVKIIPYLVAMLVAIGVFRASGAMDYILNGLASFVDYLGFDSRFVPGLPTAMMKPLSGSGARGMMVEAMNNYGADSFVGRLVSVFQGSTETTFYTVAVYFGAVGIRNTRYTIACGLTADLVGVIAAIFWTYVFFG